jgi:hypothetical protein
VSIQSNNTDIDEEKSRLGSIKTKKRKYAKNQVTVAPRWEESRLASFEAQEKQEIY